ncbi:MAG TPA: D-aminoacylase, partial [Candidatus Limnocylindria bacterium]|nr:D-aminoacylase [Candidatus Limnocylindria bacterium]
TSAPAQRIGLVDRGIVSDGAVADLVIFDPDAVRATCTYEEPCSYPEGIGWVIVNGEVVVREGVHTGARPGRVLRRGR